ncbi:MAG: UDP-N-acetylmuramoyl-tripeptide--D-alanyl-D-alanine ligase [Hyphomicrobium aestuarii]|nr:UDP-N-acetylmuramoyl-tripeptide--D-alanyl-D-alanine ligase [Hyphomicrobium aestuarii]
MIVPLWTRADLVAATGAVVCEPAEKVGGRDASPRDGEHVAGITGISIDTRTIVRGDLFVALKDARDGQDFITAAFNKGAAAALVAHHYARQPDDGLLLRVDDPLAALEALGRAARDRLSPDARVIAVTGSAGKTTTKEMLRTALSAIGPTHASEKSYNNHWGVPLTLARMPASTRFGVFEIGMNHAGEITPLSRMVRPHIAIITTVGEAHIEHFPDGVTGIARAKAEIFSGADNGWAVIPYDNPHYLTLAEAARSRRTLQLVPFLIDGPVADPDSPNCARLMTTAEIGNQTVLTVQLPSGSVQTFQIGLFGRHNISNAVAVAAVIGSLTSVDFGPSQADAAFAALATMTPPPGRGARSLLGPSDDILLIDESYNANPESMRAALATLAQVPRDRFPRRIAVLGDMLELGANAPQLHAGLAADLDSAAVDLLLACGPNMKHLYDALPTSRQGTWAEMSAGLVEALLAIVRSGDVIMIKGSNGSRMAPLVDALKSRHDLAAPPH